MESFQDAVSSLFALYIRGIDVRQPYQNQIFYYTLNCLLKIIYLMCNFFFSNCSEIEIKKIKTNTTGKTVYVLYNNNFMVDDDSE
jgi:hypothetical protein